MIAIASARAALSLALVCLAAFAPACSSTGDANVSAQLDRTQRSASALDATVITAVTGTYGADCAGRSAAGTDSWTVSTGGHVASNELSVRRNDTGCVLTLDGIVTAEGTYVGTPSIALATSYKATASAFALAGGAVAFRANASISALTFTEDLTLSLLVSVSPSASDGGAVSAIVDQPGETPDLRSAASFAVLAGSTVTNAGDQTVIDGDLGVSPGTAFTGMPVGQPSGATWVGADGVVVQAQQDLATLYDDLASRPCTPANTLTEDLAGKTLRPGVYCFAAAATLGIGTLTLDAAGDPNAYWVFQIGSTLTVSASTVTVINGGTPCNVFWQIGSSATVLDNAVFAGNIVAYTSITLDTNASITPGRALARGGAVTMLSNQVSPAACR